MAETTLGRNLPAEQRPRARILIVEDEEMSRALVRASIGHMGDESVRSAELVEAETLARARQAMAGGHFDLIVLDMHLPDGNGVDFAREIRALPAGARPRVLIVSASVLPDERAAALQSGADRFIGKPYRPDEVVEAISELLAQPAPI